MITMKQVTRVAWLVLLAFPLLVHAAEESKSAAEPVVKSAAQPGETFALKFAFKPEEAKSYVADSSMEIKSQIGQIAMPVTTLVNMTFSLKTASIDPNGVASIAINMATADGEIEFSGQKQKMPPQMMQNRSQSIKVSPRGELLEGDETASPAALGPAGPGVGMLAQGLFVLLPDKQVAVGETWKQEKEAEIPGSQQKMKETIESVLKDVVELNGEKVALITCKENRIGKNIEIDTQALAKKGAPMPPQVGKLTIHEMTQDRDISIQFSLNRGVVVSLKELFTMSSSISGMGAPNQSVTMNMSGTTSIKELK